MKRWLVLAWLLIPVALISYQFGPGRRVLAWQQAERQLVTARQWERKGEWDKAIEAYREALVALPTEREPSRDVVLARDQLRLAQIHADFQLGHLLETIDALRALGEEVAQTHGTESAIYYDVRDQLGRVHFQAMVALRLESAEEALWKRQWELSRQNFRYLAEHSPPSRNALDRKNLEAVIKSADLPVTAFAAPAGGGTAAGGPPTLTTALAKANANAPPTKTDQRPRPAPEGNVQLDPPEFKLGY